MNDYIFLMHTDVQKPPNTETDAAWGKYIEVLNKSGCFRGGSALGGGQCFTRSGPPGEITAHIGGYIQVQAKSLDDARKFLDGNPVFEGGGTVEIRELSKS